MKSKLDKANENYDKVLAELQKLLSTRRLPVIALQQMLINQGIDSLIRKHGVISGDEEHVPNIHFTRSGFLGLLEEFRQIVLKEEKEHGGGNV
jgi:hypothetical protein